MFRKQYTPITETDLREWRELYAGGLGLTDIGRRYGRSAGTVQNALRRKEGPRRGFMVPLEVELLFTLRYAHRVPWAALAAIAGRTPQGVEHAVNGWNRGTSRLAQQAKASGVWPRGGGVPEDADQITLTRMLLDLRDRPALPDVDPAPKAQGYMTEAEVRLLARASEEGHTWHALARAVGRTPQGVKLAVEGWQGRTSRLALKAIASGTWSS